jgi:succinate dehydrogenase flavin-adding protein (antitoxin of CptAB toxin-antitoxin module)
MKELDVLLGAWLERSWPEADESRRRSFQWLLEQPDPDLADWLIGGLRPADAGHAALVDDIVRRRD